MNEVVITFSDDNKLFIVYRNNSKYYACKQENSEVTHDLNNKEKALINTVFEGLKIKSNIKLSNISFNNKEYIHYLDKINDIHFFKNIDGSEITKEELTLLNMKFNYQENVVYSDSTIQEKKYFQRVFHLGTKTIVAIVLSSISISIGEPLLAKADNNTFEVINEIAKEEEKTSNLTDEEKIASLKQAILNNNNLTNEEKNFILSDFKMIEDNIKVINYDLVLERYKDLTINYTISQNVEGARGACFEKTIEMYFTKDFASADKAILRHEVNHLAEVHGNHLEYYEPANTMFTKEYSNQNDGGYETKYLMALMEIIGNEPVRKCKLTGTDDEIKEKLLSIIPDENMYYDFRYNLRETIARSKFVIGYKHKVLEYISKYFKAKTGKEIYEDINMLSILYPDLIEQKPLENKNDNEKYLVPLQKDYFNSKSENYLKQNCMYKVQYETYIDEEKYIRETYKELETIPFEDERIKTYMEENKEFFKEGIEKEYLYSKIRVAEKEIENVRNNDQIKKKVKEEKMLYQKNGKVKINLTSKYAKKINKELSQIEGLSYEYSIISQFDLLSIRVFKNQEIYRTYNIKLSSGKKFKIAKFLNEHDIDYNDISMVNFQNNEVSEDNLFIYGVNKNSKTYGLQSILTLPPKEIADGLMNYNTIYAETANKYIKEHKLKLSDKYYLVGNTYQFVYYNNKELQVYTVDKQTGEYIDIKDYIPEDMQEMDNIVVDEEGNIISLSIENGQIIQSNISTKHYK